MAVHVRARRAAGPLGEEARARLRCAGYASSGSDQGAATCLSGLVHAFLERGGHDSSPSGAAPDIGSVPDPDDSPEEDTPRERDLAAGETVRQLMSPAVDSNPFRRRLATDVSRAAEGLNWLRSSCGETAFRRAMMARLRAAGYKAGICETRWDASGGLAAGSYEYLDVVAAAGDGRVLRYIVDLDFAAEFEVARATDEYKEVLATLPRVAVAAEETMRQAVRAAADTAQRSLRARGLHVPPWRKSRYMLAKWLGPYRRTTNPLPASSVDAPATPARATGPQISEAQCRAVGFPTAPGLVAPPTAKTRYREASRRRPRNCSDSLFLSLPFSVFFGSSCKNKIKIKFCVG